jgi:phage FluMu protein Com
MSDKADLPASGKDVRCICGRMTARLEPEGLVIKCQRCGKLVVISLSKIKGLKKLLNLP